jgi:hypothetical protein
MKRRNLGLGIGLAILGSSMFLLAGSASAAEPPAAEACKVISQAGFTAQGEFTTTGTVADVIEVECNPEVYGTKAKLKIEAYQVFSRCEHKLTWYVPNQPNVGFRKVEGLSVPVELDPDGNATVALLAGPNCTVGSDNMITVHMESQPFESFTTSFAILPPALTPQGVKVTPAHQVEDAYSSAFATIIQAEFPGISEQKVRIGSEELYHRCRLAPHLRWIGIDGSEHKEVSELTGVPLDNDGNGFVIVIGDASCAPGRSLIEADLEESPFTTLPPAYFTVEAPRPT